MISLRGGRFYSTSGQQHSFFQQAPKYYFLFNTVVHARPKIVRQSAEVLQTQIIQNTEKERKQVGKLVIDAFRSEFKSSDPHVSKLYPYILQIPAPPTPPEFLWMEKEIVANGNAKYLKTGGFLTPYQYTVPSVNGTKEDKCSLTRYPVCSRFQNEVLNKFMVDIFQAIANETGKNGVPKIDLTRYDLFHGHFFLDYAKTGVGIIYHSKEYPQINETDFPYNLGYCQHGSDLQFTPFVMNHRNILWFKGQLGVLNVDEAGAMSNLVWDLLRPVDTVLESDLGDCPADVNFFQQLPFNNPSQKLFIC